MIDAETGAILSHGQCGADDLFRQALPPGEMFVARPACVTCFDPWRYVDGEWVLEDDA